MKIQGLPIVISAPSGSGKSTIANKIVEALPSAVMSVSCTTRPPRPGEVNGQHYYFISEEDFKKKIKAGEFLEWAEVHGHHYGTPMSHLKQEMEQGHDVILAIDVQGGLSVKRFYPKGVYIFLVPPTWDVLEKRLRDRASDDEQTIKMRMSNARKELSYLSHYDYLVINDNLDQALADVSAVLKAERCRLSRIDQNQIPILNNK